MEIDLNTNSNLNDNLDLNAQEVQEINNCNQNTLQGNQNFLGKKSSDYLLSRDSIDLNNNEIAHQKTPIKKTFLGLDLGFNLRRLSYKDKG